MAITAAMVKELRDMTGAGMMDCKKALTETDGDLEKAVDVLRTKGLADLAKKAGRATNEGLVASWVSENGKIGAMVEVNCETDFVARNAEFSTFANAIAEQVAVDAPNGVKDGESALMDLQWKRNPSLTVQQALGEIVGRLGENMGVSRFARYEITGDGCIGSYIHGVGRIGVIVDIAGGEASDPAVATLAKDVAMHIAAATPICVRREEVPADTVEHEMSIYKAQAEQSGKPEPIQEKIAQGRLEKFYKEVCLIEQSFVKDPDKSVEQIVKDAAKATGKDLRVVRFDRFVLGETAAKEPSEA
ncbi:MAG: translation elongation factor Ts [Coriobacteriia bacterium]|nr:translation elongation factor Ts [Coriobacteriia bacterium]